MIGGRCEGNGRGCEGMGEDAREWAWPSLVPVDLPSDEEGGFWSRFAGTGWRIGTETSF